MRKKRIFAVIVLCITVFAGGCGKEEAVSFVKNQVAQAMEPEEVKKLRDLEIASVDGEHQEHCFQQLSEEEQRVYRQLQRAVEEFQEEIYLTTADEECVDRAYEALGRDHPELFWIRNKQVSYKTIYQTYTVFQPGYLETSEEALQVQQAMEEACNEVAQRLDSGSRTYDKVKTVYEYVIWNTQYQESDRDQSISGVFGQKKAVCAGYASAVQYLLERLGVECYFVTGQQGKTGENHAWNIVNIDGSYVYVDATSADQPEFLGIEEEQMQNEQVTMYDYLCPFPEEYKEMFQPSDDFTFPECTENRWNYYMLHESCFTGFSLDEAVDCARAQIDGGSTVVRFKYTDEEGFQKAWEVLGNSRNNQEIPQYYMEFQGTSQLEYYSGSLQELKTIYFIF